MSLTGLSLAAAGGFAVASTPAALLLYRSRGMVNQLRSALDHVRQLANSDALTGLANRRTLEEHLAKRALFGEAYAVILVDLNGFKQLNDTYGHDAGDLALQSVGRRLAALAEADHGLAARLGGDEFVFVAPSQTSRMSRVHGAGVYEAVTAPVLINGVKMTLEASVGVVHALPGDPTDRLLRAADIAMYRAKVAGGGVSEHDVALTLPSAASERPLVRLRESSEALRFLAEVA